MITLGLPKFSKISFVFNIFVPIPVQEMVYLKAIQKITPVDVFVSGTTDQKTYLKKFWGVFSPLSPPLDPPMCIAFTYQHELLYRKQNGAKCPVEQNVKSFHHAKTG